MRRNSFHTGQGPQSAGGLDCGAGSSETTDEIRAAVGRYLAEIVAGFEGPAATSPHATPAAETASLQVFRILTSRPFCYLSRSRTAPYEADAVSWLEQNVKNREPMRFYYDVGAGYHACVRPVDEDELRFDVGLSEMLILYQVASFCRRVAEVYPFGARFYLVVDNLCALLVNDIPVEETTGYCARLRSLIQELGVGDHIELLVESENFSPADYDPYGKFNPEETTVPEPSEKDIDNVQRFLGRECDSAEARERMARYKHIGPITDTLINGIVRGVHMTQRATASTLGFRPFPGGDSRTQCGEVAIGRNSKGKLRPFLLTSQNIGELNLTRLSYPDLLPPSVPYVTHAEPIDR